MEHERVSKPKRRPVNLSLEADTIAAARELGINISQACDQALATAVKLERERRWTEENRQAIEANNAWVEKHGLPLARYRMF